MIAKRPSIPGNVVATAGDPQRAVALGETPSLPSASSLPGRGAEADPVSPKQPAAELVRFALRGALARIRAAEPAALHGDVEGVHRLRTATRRLRSELSALARLLDPKWRRSLQAALKDLASDLGGVRDLDILDQRLRQAADFLRAGTDTDSEDSPGETVWELFGELKQRHDRNTRILEETLRSDRYRDLIATIEQATADPPLTAAAQEPCGKVLPGLVAASWKRLRKRAVALSPESSEEEFHEVRKRAKQARYTAELIAPALGLKPREQKQAARYIRLCTAVQDTLGLHQDATVAAAEIERFLAEHGRGDGRRKDGEELLKHQRQEAREARERFFKIRKKLDRAKSVSWFERRVR